MNSEIINEIVECAKYMPKIQEAIKAGKLQLSEECLQDIEARITKLGTPFAKPINNEEIKDWQVLDQQIGEINFDKIIKQLKFIDVDVEGDHDWPIEFIDVDVEGEIKDQKTIKVY